MSSSEAIDKESGRCKGCLDIYKDHTEFLYHIRRKNNCSSAYDESYLENIRRQQRLKSKRKWFNKNYESRIKNERKQRRIEVSDENPKTPKYIQKIIKESKEGKNFQYIFTLFYHENLAKAKKRISEIANDPSQRLKIEEMNHDQALDQTFDFEEIEIAFNRVEVNSIKYDDEERFLSDFFVQLEIRFENVINAKMVSATKSWMSDTYDNIRYKVYPLETAFKRCFDKDQVKTVLENATDTAMDKIFSELVMVEHYFTYDECDESGMRADHLLEDKMFSVFQNSILPQEIKSLCHKVEPLSKLESIIENSFTKCFSFYGLSFKLQV